MSPIDYSADGGIARIVLDDDANRTMMKPGGRA